MAGKRILIVDDDAGVRRVVERIIGLNLRCETTTADSGEQALGLLKKQSFDVIVSDIEMPGMNGAELLRVVQELYPATIRLAFSGSSDQDMAFQTAGSVHQYLQKPADLSLLSKKIQNVLSLRRLLPAEGLEHVVGCVKSLPALPQSYLKLEKELSSKAPSVDRVGKILSQDIAMSVKVLHLVNSAFFGLRERVTSAEQAAALLGVNTIRSLVLAFHVFSVWKGRRVPGFNPDSLWTHSLGVASLVRDICDIEGVDKELREDMQIAGMFHDMGKLLLADNVPESCEAIEAIMVGEDKTALEAERRVLGATHAETGAYLLALWGFGERIVSGTAFHHNVRGSGAKGISSELLVHVANALDYEKVGRTTPVDIRVDVEFLDAQGLKPNYLNWRTKLLA